MIQSAKAPRPPLYHPAMLTPTQGKNLVEVGEEIGLGKSGYRHEAGF